MALQMLPISLLFFLLTQLIIIIYSLLHFLFHNLILCLLLIIIPPSHVIWIPIFGPEFHNNSWIGSSPFSLYPLSSGQDPFVKDGILFYTPSLSYNFTSKYPLIIIGSFSSPIKHQPKTSFIQIPTTRMIIW